MVQAYAKPESCTEGHQYTQDCNTCTCTTTGIYACTRMACYHGPQFPDTAPETPKSKRDLEDEHENSGCDKGASYFDGCNTCVCQGNHYACTLKACFPNISIQPLKPAVAKREIEESTGNYSPPRGHNTNILRLDIDPCTPGEVKNQVSSFSRIFIRKII